MSLEPHPTDSWKPIVKGPERSRRMIKSKFIGFKASQIGTRLTNLFEGCGLMHRHTQRTTPSLIHLSTLTRLIKKVLGL